VRGSSSSAADTAATISADAARGGAAGSDGDSRGYRTWGTGYVVTGDLDGDGNADGTNYTIAGFGGGGDTTIGENVRLGLAVGFTGASGTFDGHQSDTESVTWNGGLYGQWAKDRWRVDGILGAGYRDNTVNRKIDVGSINRRSDVSYHSTLWSASALVRYLIPVEMVNIEPLAGIRYFKSDAKSFTESGADSVDLRGSVRDFQSVRSALGATFSRELAGKRGPIIIEARLAWEHEFQDRSAKLDARFVGATGSDFVAKGVDVDRDSALVGLGMRAQVDRNATLMAQYAGRFNNDVQAHQFSAAVRWDW